MTVMIDGRDYDTPRALHLALKRLLGLPAYYGCNADALHDCLAERTEETELWVASCGTGEVAAAVARCMSVVEDLGGRARLL